MKTKVLLSVVCLCFAAALCAQQPHEQTNAGTDFWVTSMHVAQYFPSETEESYGMFFSDSVFAAAVFQITQSNWYSDHDSSTIQIVGLEDCSGYVTNPSTGWRVDFHVQPGSVTEITVPAAQIMCYESTEIQHKGCHIHTECEVWAYLLSNQCLTMPIPATTVLPLLQRNVSKIQLTPIQTYQDEYYLFNTMLTVGWYQHLSYFIVATEDNTQVSIPSHWEANNFPNCSELSGDFVGARSFSLNAGDVLTVCGLLPDSIDIENRSYLHIQTNCKPVAIYYGITDAPLWIQLGLRYPAQNVFNIYNQKGNGRDFLWEDFESIECLHFITFYPSICDSGTVQIQSSAQSTDLLIGTLLDFQDYAALRYIFFEHNMRFFFNWIEVCAEQCIDGMVPPYPAADRRVKEVVMPTRKDTFSDRMKVILSICVPPEGIHSTTLNGTPIPSSDFQTRPEISDRYYMANVVFYDNAIPPLLHITNPLGFSATLQEISFDSSSIAHQWTMCGSGCTYTDNFNFNDTLLACVGDTLHLTTYLDCGHAPLTWVVDGTEYQQDDLLFPVEAADTLVVMLIEDNFCWPDTSYGIIYAPGVPQITLPADTVICHGASITAQCDISGFCHWSDGTEGSTLVPQEEGDYTVCISNTCGSDSATVHVRFYEDMLHVDFGNDTLLCRFATLLLDATQQHPATYLWQDESTNTTYTVIEDGQYWVVVTDGCTGASDTINVAHMSDLQVDLGTDTAICYNQPYILDATTPNCHYLWHDGTTSPTHEVKEPGTYSVYVYNACGGTEASITVRMIVCEDIVVHVPNAFTPNGDGQNDLFLPVFNYPERLEIYSLHVYDRWGRLQFSTDNPYQGWNCNECPAGVYVWRMEYKAAGEKPQLLTGSVTVVR